MGLKIATWWSTLINGLGWERNIKIGTIWSNRTEIANAVSTDGGDDVRVCFRNLTNETTLLCWVDKEGKPHHFYKLRPYRGRQRRIKTFGIFMESDDDHVETTCCGHVFILSRSDDVDVCSMKKCLDGATTFAAYRPDSASPSTSLCCSEIDEDSIVHLVTISCRQTKNQLLGCFDYCGYENDDNSDGNIALSVSPVVIDPTPIDSTCKIYNSCVLGHCEWPVFVDSAWCNYDDSFKIDFERDLDQAISYLPEHCRDKLRRDLPTPIWINRSLKYGPRACPVNGRGMCFHPEKSWLVKNGMHPEKCKSIELYSTECYKQSRSLWGIGGLLLHEFSHAYHNKCSGYNNKEIIQCYEAAMKDGLYDNVRVKGSQGPTAKAYACENAMEYFAELSTAFLGGVPKPEESDEKPEADFNKWYPFNREQIRLHDPRAYKMLTKLWCVKEEKMMHSA